jgi:hypothetical protein
VASVACVVCMFIAFDVGQHIAPNLHRAGLNGSWLRRQTSPHSAEEAARRVRRRHQRDGDFGTREAWPA